MKLQDLNYLRMKKMQDDKKIERLSGELHGLTATPLDSTGTKGKKHVIFLEDQGEIKNWNAAEHFDTAEELMDRSFNRPHLKDLKEKPIIMGKLQKDSLKVLEKKTKTKV